MAVRHGRTVAHNLLPPEVYDLRLADKKGEVEILKQSSRHTDPEWNVALCPECAEILGGRFERLQQESIKQLLVYVTAPR